MPVARIDGIDLAYDVRGTGDAIVLIMGLGMPMVLWQDDFCDRLASRGFRVVRFDNRDVGQSSKLDGLGVPKVRAALVKSIVGVPFTPPYRMEDMADDVRGLLDHLGIDRCHVVGASMGGMIAQTLAARAPERLWSLTSIMSSPGGLTNSIGKPRAMKMLLTRPTSSDRDAQIERFVTMFRVLAGTGFPFDAARMRELAVAQCDRGISLDGTARQLAAVLESNPRRPALVRTIRTPTLVIHGDEDPLIPLRAGRATARLVPGAELLVVRGMGHGLPPGAWPRITDAIAAHAHRARLTP